MTIIEEARLRKNFTKEECERLLGDFCKSNKALPTHTQIDESKELPSWGTLNAKLGPWWTWNKMFDVKVRDKRRQAIIDEKNREEQEKEAFRLESRRKFEEKVAKGLVTPVVTFRV